MDSSNIPISELFLDLTKAVSVSDKYSIFGHDKTRQASKYLSTKSNKICDKHPSGIFRKR